MVSHKVSCWPLKAVQQGLAPAATQDRIQDLYAAQVPPAFLDKALNAMGVTANARCWETPERGPRRELALLAIANQRMSRCAYVPFPTQIYILRVSPVHTNYNYAVIFYIHGTVHRDSMLTFWRRNYFFNFSTLCI